MDLKTLSLTDVLNVEDVWRFEIDLPEWGGKMILQQMTAEGRDAFEQSLLKKTDDGFERDLTNARAKLIAACAINEDGTLMFRTADHVKALGQRSAKVMDRIFAKCQEINAISDGDIEELEKN